MKTRLASDLLPAIRAALTDQSFISPAVRFDEAQSTSPESTDWEKQNEAGTIDSSLGVPGTPMFAWDCGVAIRKTKIGCQVRSLAANSPSNAI